MALRLSACGRARSRQDWWLRCGRPAELGDVLVAGLDALTDRGLLTGRTDRQRLLTIGFDDLRGILHHANRCTGHHLSRRNGLPAPTLSLQPADAHGRRVSAGEGQGALDGRFHDSADHGHRDAPEEQCATGRGGTGDEPRPRTRRRSTRGSTSPNPMPSASGQDEPGAA